MRPSLPIFKLLGPTYNSVTGTFVVPMVRQPAGGTGTYVSSAWVGIDGASCQLPTILHTGVDFIVNDTSQSYKAWVEWYPAGKLCVEDFPVGEGDRITASVAATSRTDGTATLVNHSTGKTVSHTFCDQPELCDSEGNADWIFEDYSSDGVVTSGADWGTVTFTDMSVRTMDNDTLGAEDATIINNITQDDGHLLSDVSIDDSSITIQYIGP